MVLALYTGIKVPASQLQFDGYIFGLGVDEGLIIISSSLSLIHSDLNTSIYLAMLQHLLYKPAKVLHLPLEMWDWIAKYRVSL
jgi:hypothetical protein